MSSTWQAKNPEKWREYKRAYYEQNKAAISAKKREWERANRDKLKSQRDARASEYAARREQNKERLRPSELLRGARRRAKLSGVPFSITVADIQIPAFCPLLGIPLVGGSKRLAAGSPSLDRKINSLGYIPGNVWVISHRANKAKGGLTADELIMIGTRLKDSLAVGAVS
jgi:hypothetical protein